MSFGLSFGWLLLVVSLAVDGVAGGGGPGEPLSAGGLHGPVVSVGDAVVMAAEEDEVVGVGGAVVVPVGDVMRVAPVDGCPASGEHTSTVSHSERFAEVVGGVSPSASVGEDGALGVEL